MASPGLPTPAHYAYITTATGSLTTPGSPRILIHTRQGKIAGIYCDRPAKVLEVETQGNPKCATHPSYLAMLAMISPQTSVKVVGGYGKQPIADYRRSRSRLREKRTESRFYLVSPSFEPDASFLAAAMSALASASLPFFKRTKPR